MRKTVILVLVMSVFYSCINDNTAKSDSFILSETEISKKQIQVLTLGTFHFNFPNLDIAKTDDADKIDVLDAKYQKEIESIVQSLAQFEPTKIVIEREPKQQKQYDSLYNAYLNGKHSLSRSEEQQIGFRLAKMLGLNQLYCTDAWGSDYEETKKITEGTDTISKNRFIEYFYTNPDSLLYSFKDEKTLFKSKGILAELKKMNSEEYVKKGLGDYLIGVFKYETEDYKQFGPDYVTSWWFNRNLRIFRNIQRIDATAEDRILVIYGAGHMNLLNVFFEASPEYNLIPVNSYLK